MSECTLSDERLYPTPNGKTSASACKFQTFADRRQPAKIGGFGHAGDGRASRVPPLRGCANQTLLSPRSLSPRSLSPRSLSPCSLSRGSPARFGHQVRRVERAILHLTFSTLQQGCTFFDVQPCIGLTMAHFQERAARMAGMSGRMSDVRKHGAKPPSPR